MVMARQLLVALHDVTPAHGGGLERAEQLFAALGISPVTYLLVPNFHGRAPAHESADFISWCRRRRTFEVHWFLHGYFHDEQTDSGGRSTPLTVTKRLAATVLTSGEAEFLRLRGHRLHARIHDGILSFRRCLGEAPSGFVAPAWLFNDELRIALKHLHVRYTENHFHLFDTIDDRTAAAPVVTWSSRTWSRRVLSVAAAATTRRLLVGCGVVRVAVHPADFGHPRIVDSLTRTLDVLRSDRVLSSYRDLTWSVP